MSQTPAFVVLNRQGMLAVRGTDASKFLQGQLTCNLNYVSYDQSSLGARCNPKGRMQSSFRLAMQGDGFLLSMARELVQPQLAEIKKFAVFSKSTLQDESDQWVQLGLINPEHSLQELGIELADTPGAVTQHNQMLAIRINRELAELWIPAADAPCTQRQLATCVKELDDNAWQLGLIAAGIAQVTQATYESYIPQMLNLPALDAVSFKKGCYSGQEIVARMQYLGKQKRHMLRFGSTTSELPVTGTALLQADGSKAGEVLSAAHSGDTIELLAIVLVETAQEQPLFLDVDGRPQTKLLDLPYQIDVEREIQR